MSTPTMQNAPLIPPTVKIPQQHRSRAKFNAMLEAAERLFAEQGIPHAYLDQYILWA